VTIQLAIVRPDGTELTYLTDYSAGQVTHPVWGAQGELFYSLTGLDENADGIYRLSADRETHEKLLSGSDLQTLSLSPDGEFLAYQSGSRLSVWSFALGQTIGVTPAAVDSPATFIDWLSAQE
jgi:Tol biopolymer transport system component